MKLVVVIPSFYPAVIYGGTIFSSYNTCNELSNVNKDLKVITTNANGNERLNVKSNTFLPLNKYQVKYYNETIIGRFSRDLLLGIKNDLKEADIVLLHGLFSTPIPITLFWAAILNKKIVLTPHGEFGHWCLTYKRTLLKKLWLKFLIKPFLKNIIWQATAKTEELEILSIFPDANVNVVPNGISLKEFKNYNKLDKSQYVKQFAKKEVKASHIIISVGRLHKKKGFDILIKSFKQVQKTFPDSIVFIAGEDEGEKKQLLRLVDELELTDRVIFVGKIEGDNKTDFFANADLFVLPSHNENFGIVYAESLASGTPIVASTGTPWEDVETANCGKWVPNTVEDTTSAILDLLSRNRDDLRQNALRFIEKFDWKEISLVLYTWYQELLNKKSSIVI